MVMAKIKQSFQQLWIVRLIKKTYKYLKGGHNGKETKK